MAEPLYYIGLSQALFAAFIIITRLRKQAEHYIMFAWLLVIAAKMGVLIWWSEFPILDLNFANLLLPYTLGPFLFLYTKYLIYSPRFKRRDLLHFVPFLLLSTVYLLFYKTLQENQPNSIRVVHGSLFMLSALYYSGMTIYLVLRFRSHIRDHFSYVTIRNKMIWIYFVAALLVIVFLLQLILGIVGLFKQEVKIDLRMISDTGLVLLTFAVAYFGVRQQTIKEHDVPEEEEEEEALPEEEKEKTNFVSEENVPVLIERLNQKMEKDKPYLNPELTVLELAREIDIPRHHLTELLNEHLGMNFFHFVNQYRVAEVQERLLDPKNEQLTIVAIAFDSGFNSKSSFNSIFKQFTQTTPSRWRKAQKEKDKKKA